uniref:SNTX MACPF/CDC-like domain-containing protein n=1 Tax=Panagrolaimus davidi TaxID=227884 RepID=A0A914PKI5_9BILA
MLKIIGLLLYFCYCNGSVLNVPALGRTADFGDIYDARINKFTKDSIFKRTLTSNFKKLIENPYTRYEFTSAKSRSEKLSAFEIGGELKLQIMCGVVDVGGSAKYLTDNQYTSQHEVKTYILKSRIATESFNWKDEEIRNFTDFSHVITEGTHVVVGIQYGGAGVVTLSQIVKEGINRHNIQAKLDATIKKFTKIGISGSIEGSSNSSTKDNSESLKIKVEADVNFEADDDLTTLEGTYIFMKKLGGRLLKYNNGKGVQTTFEMIPLTVILKFYQKSSPFAIHYSPLTVHHYSSMNHKLIKIENIIQSFNEKYSKLKENQMYFSNEEIEEYEEIKMKINENISVLYQKIETDIVAFHNHTMKHDKVSMHELHIHPLKLEVEKFLEYSDLLLDNVNLIKYAMENGTIYIDTYSKLEDIKLRHEKIVFLFFYMAYKSEIRLKYKMFLQDFVQYRPEKNAVYAFVNVRKILPIVIKEIPFVENNFNPLYIYVNSSYHTYTWGDKILFSSVGLKKQCKTSANTTESHPCPMKIIFPAGTKLPTEKFEKQFKIGVDDQENVHQGNSIATKELGEMKVETLKEKAGEELFILSMEINNDGILIAEFKSLNSNKADKLEVNLHIY